MIKIEGTESNFGYFEVRSIGWTKFVELSNSAVGKTSRELSTSIQRQRLLAQVKAFDAEGNPAKSFTAVEIAALPTKIGKALVKAASEALDTKEEPAILSEDCDGITKPILMKLAQPLVLGDEKIIELEFMAKTFGDIESVMALDNNGPQSIALIETVARPITSNLKLQALPSWAVEQISVMDGMFIAQKVMPSFLE